MTFHAYQNHAPGEYNVINKKIHIMPKMTTIEWFDYVMYSRDLQ